MAAVRAQERADCPAFLLRLAERELLDRERRAAERRVRAARFPVIKSLETFDFAAQPSINAALVRELVAHGQYLVKKANVLLVGNPGTGQTHLATALVTELLEARESRALARRQKQLERLDRCHARPAHSPRPHPRSQRRQLPAQGRQKTPQTPVILSS